jgi:hypothetical protein
MRRFIRLALLGFAAITLAHATVASAQNFTGKTIRIIVPFAPGGTSDILARALANKLGEGLSATVVVDNKPGANGILGSDLVAKSAPDGLTLLLSDMGGLTTGPALGAKYPFDAQKDFSPITMVAYSPHLVVVANSVPVKTLAELVAASRDKAGGLSAATSGAGSAPHLASSLQRRRASHYRRDCRALSGVVQRHARHPSSGEGQSIAPARGIQRQALAHVAGCANGCRIGLPRLHHRIVAGPGGRSEYAARHCVQVKR